MNDTDRTAVATYRIDTAITAWRGQGIVDRIAVTDLLLDLRRILNPVTEE